jgi:hypothetical protein
MPIGERVAEPIDTVDRTQSSKRLRTHVRHVTVHCQRREVSIAERFQPRLRCLHDGAGGVSP